MTAKTATQLRQIENKYRTAVEVVEVLRAFFEDLGVLDRERRDVWNILTALRGPDNMYGDGGYGRPEIQERKRATTARLRWAVIGFRTPADANDLPWPAEGFVKKEVDLEHWSNHMGQAYDSLKRMGLLKQRKPRKVSSLKPRKGRKAQ